MTTRKTTKRQKLKPQCGICNGPHHSLDHGTTKTPAQFDGGGNCQQCGKPVEFTGPFCIDCTFDRFIGRLATNLRTKGKLF